MIQQKPKRVVVAIMLGAVLGIGAVELLIAMHPFGYAISVLVAIVLFGAIIILLRHIVAKRFRPSEFQKTIDEVTDEVLKSRDDPNEPARFVP